MVDTNNIFRYTESSLIMQFWKKKFYIKNSQHTICPVLFHLIQVKLA